MIEFIQQIIEAIGYPGIGLMVFIENIFPPIPSEVVIPFSGFAAKRGDLSLFGVILAGVIGSVLGALPLYYVGKKWGAKGVKQFVNNRGRALGFSPDDIDRAQDWFERHGNAAVFLCRMVPGLRSVISIPAGIAEMNLTLFMVWTILGTTIWTALLALAGYFLGANYSAIQPYIDTIGWIVFIGFALFIGYRLIKTQQEQSSASG